MDKIELGKRLKSLRENVGLTQKQVGEKFGKSYQTVASWEAGKALPDSNTLLSLCQLFGVTDVLDTFGYSKSVSSLDLITDAAWFRLTAKAKAEGIAPEDIEMALDFIKRSKERWQKKG